MRKLQMGWEVACRERGIVMKVRVVTLRKRNSEYGYHLG